MELLCRGIADVASKRYSDCILESVLTALTSWKAKSTTIALMDFSPLSSRVRSAFIGKALVADLIAQGHGEIGLR